ncbi:hypothetical protein [Candidatus Mycobacterium methanotrophicum]|uniref:Uncharacterized protein n=1 Tax=Candidatus Mycobacterium methanotrophicum TaxID=2943498 RepID=A0ABY4QNE6_9MYCO|nr:hypothetical protein [Candidatus Mycobacterium methanotrophicum]UQX11140.1 hypothetical protein M5I08_00720 [Candidatus Mycobacterium methanotrophicum]
MGAATQLIELLSGGATRRISASRQATARFEAERVAAARKTVWVTGCHGWYLDDQGVPAAWPWSFGRFREVMQRPDLTDYERV